MESTSTKSKRILKNTLFLYGRTFLTMIISLYTSRINLEALGVADYGVYNVVGGFIALFAIITGPFTGAFSRYLTFAVGNGDPDYSSRLFSSILNFQIVFSLVIIFFAEPVGIWFLNNKMEIPTESLTAANWVLQCSILTFALGMINLPYSCLMVAYERMNIYAVMGIVDAAFRLGLCFFLLITPINRLITYALGQLGIYIIMRMIYGVYCTRNFPECKYNPIIDRKLIKEISSFVGWTFLGSLTFLLNTQGVTILMNLYFGVVVNGAKAIATQVEGAVRSLVSNFTVAFSPQITKSYAERDKEYMFSVMRRGTKFSVFLMLFFLIPIEFEADMVLKIWLGEVPEWAATFLRLTLLCSMIHSLGDPLYQGIMAQGNIRNYQIAVTVVGCLVFPLTWLSYSLWGNPAMFYILYITIYFILIWIKSYYANKLLGFSISDFTKTVFIPIILCIAVAFLVPLFIFLLIPGGWVRLIVLTIVSIIWTSITVLFLGMTKHEREVIINAIKKRLFFFRKERF